MSLRTTLENTNLPPLEPASQEVIDWLRLQGIDEETIQELSSCSRGKAIKVNKVYLSKFNGLTEENLYEQNARCLENGYLIIGSGLNGDPIVFSREEKKVGYVSHDELWEDDECDFRDIVYITKLGLIDFYEGALEEAFPVDIHEAEEQGI